MTKGYDVNKIRKDFPILGRKVNGKPLVYLDNAATTQKPLAVLEELERYYRSENANIHRGIHALSMEATESYEGARRKAQKFLNAARPEEIVFVRGATEAINLVAQSYGRWKIGRDDEILITGMEHHSNIVPWQILCEQTGARLKVVPITDEGELVPGKFEESLGPKTKIAAVVHVSNALGTVNPVKKMVEAAHAKGVPVLVDGAQAAPHGKVDVRDLGCDFYAVSGHKVYGPTGIGVLYGRHDLLKEMPPYQGGGEMIRSVTFEKTTYADLPHKFEAGTPDISGAIGMGAALDYVEGVGRDAIAAHEADLLAYGTKAIGAVPGVRIVGKAKEKAGVISFLVGDIHPHDVGTILDQEGVAIRTGHHCAQPVMDRFDIPATARASFGMYNTREEIDALVAALKKVIGMFG